MNKHNFLHLEQAVKAEKHMTTTEPIDGRTPSDNLICPRCSTSLLPHAIFCRACGERIEKKKNEEGEARTEDGNDEAQEQEVDDTVRLPSLSRAYWKDLQSYWSLKNNGIGQTYKSKVGSLVRRLRSDSLLRNSIYIMGTGAATSVFGYLFWILAAHIYSTYDVGLGSALISAMSLASLLANLGMGSTLVQTLPRRAAGYPWSLTLNAGLATGIVVSLLTGAIAVVALPLISQQFATVGHHVGYAFAFIAGVPLMTVSMLLDQAFIAERAVQNMLVRNAAVAVLKIPLMVLAVVLMTQVGPLGILLSGVVAMAVVLLGGMLLLVPRLKRDYCLAAHGIVGQVRSMLSSLTGHYFINLGGLSTQYLLPVVVAVRLSPADNAYYYTTARVSDFLLSVSSAVAVSLFAEGSHAADGLRGKVRSSAAILAILLVPAMLVCFFGGRYILLVFGPSYAQHGLTLLMIDAVSAVPDAITNIYVSVLRVQRRLRFAALLNLSMAALTLILSWILLPMLGIAGQGLAYLISAVAGSLAAGVDVIRIRRHRRRISGSAYSG